LKPYVDHVYHFSFHGFITSCKLSPASAAAVKAAAVEAAKAPSAEGPRHGNRQSWTPPGKSRLSHSATIEPAECAGTHSCLDAREALARLKSSRFARKLLRSTIVLLCDM
jgi:hypothetical protein